MDKSKLTLDSVSYSYQDGREFRFSDLSFEVPKNTVTCILGRNGVGKTTLLLLILGFLKPSSGIITYPHSKNDAFSHSANNKIAYLPQIETAPFNIAVSDYVLMGRVPFISPYKVPDQEDIQKVERNLELLDIQHIRDSEIGKISGGELQRVRIARALTQESDLILLDEPITHLDINAKFAMMELIQKMRNMGKTVIFTTHDPVEALQISDLALLIHSDRNVVFGPTPQVVTSHNLSECFNIPIIITIHETGYACVVQKKL